MLFHSIDFLVFFAVVFPVHALLRKTPFMNAWLLLSSYFFYAWGNPVYLLLIIATTLVDFYVVRRIEAGPKRRLWLGVSLASNLGALAFFKYVGFFTRNLNDLLALIGLPSGVPVYAPALPLGISFFTFQSLSYAIDVYRGELPAERNLLRYATYVSFFPQMISGPICRAGWLLPQLRGVPVIRTEDVTTGASLILVGLFKKVAIADYLALYVDKVYGAPEQFQAPALLMATFAFAWQIYFDFSGYTDMARGIARAMGFNLSRNFNAPYAASGLGEFWGRWNITVSNWFRDYVYIPLGGNRHGNLKTARNILLTMIISGVWHGANWTFILWGALHGVGRIATRELGPLAAFIRKTPPWVHRVGVFCFVTFAWIFFRAGSIWDASLIVNRIFTSGWEDSRFPVLMLVPILLVWIWQLAQESERPGRRLLDFAPVRVALAVLMLGYLIFVTQLDTQKFIYFNF
jgi:D-alanyl-lipoteichoic acid acyltransferase DltB (MBOAT superfamily)